VALDYEEWKRCMLYRQRIAGMSEAEFDALIDGSIERSAASSGELPADVFFDLLLERIAARTSAAPEVKYHWTGDFVSFNVKARRRLTQPP
jgi:hypothetical protein